MSSPQRSLSVAVLGSAVLTGLVLHQALKPIPVDRYPWSVVGSVIAFYLFTACVFRYVIEDISTFSEARHLAFWITSCILASLCTSSLIYRAFLHPLHHFPGPFGAKLSKLWSLRQVIRSKSRWHRVSVELHEKYGDYVRTGRRPFPKPILYYIVHRLTV